jgi:trehalose 6-phosphate synthase
LAVALTSALRETGGLWLGWSGGTVDEASDEPAISTRSEDNIDFALIDLTRRDQEEYYQGFANRALWPLLHYRLDLVDFDRRDTSGFFRVNAMFASVLAERLQPDDVVWVHDYHLIPLGQALRARGVKNRIGFFLHIPWPPPDVFMAIPLYQRLLEAFTAYDLVGFQTDYDADNFLNCLRRAGIGRQTGASSFAASERSFEVAAFPIGIDARAFAASAKRTKGNPLVRRMAESLRGRTLIVGVDRLDYSKGINQRMLAYERFLNVDPAKRGRVVYLQVTPKSRSEVPEYAAMQREVAETAGRINGALGDIDWVPIRYLNRTIKHSTLSGLYRMAKVGLVTPLRDGMNLVAKEFVAAQDPEDPGVLVLSRFAGAARELTSALLVNPYDLDATAAAIAEGVAMPRDERIARWRAMYARVMENEVHRWRRSFLDRLTKPAPIPGHKVPLRQAS